MAKREWTDRDLVYWELINYYGESISDRVSHIYSLKRLNFWDEYAYECICVSQAFNSLVCYLQQNEDSNVFDQIDRYYQDIRDAYGKAKPGSPLSRSLLVTIGMMEDMTEYFSVFFGTPI